MPPPPPTKTPAQLFTRAEAPSHATKHTASNPREGERERERGRELEREIKAYENVFNIKYHTHIINIILRVYEYKL